MKEMAVEGREVSQLEFRWDAVEEREALVERRAREALEFRVREEFLWRWAARWVSARAKEERARRVDALEREEPRWPGGFRVRGRGFLVCAGL